MVKTALFVRLQAKPGKEAEVEGFLRGGLPIVEEEPATVAWFGIRLGPTTFGIFDAFPDEAGRQVHLSGKVAAALMAKASELLATAAHREGRCSCGEASLINTSLTRPMPPTPKWVREHGRWPVT